jgi:hypothetical protein
MRPSMPSDFERLFQAALDAEQTHLARAIEAERQIHREVVSLRLRRAELHRHGLTEDFHYQTRLTNWASWCDARLACLLRDLAARRAEREVLTAAVRRAFGRRQTVSALIDRQSVNAQAKRRRAGDPGSGSGHTS